jgi:hypothetical protein
MSTRKSMGPLAAAALACLWGPLAAHAECGCETRPATAAEKRVYDDAYALFLKAAPAAPAGWSFTDSPEPGQVPVFCVDVANPPVPRSFTRQFQLEEGRQERQDQAMAAYSDMAQKSQDMQAKNAAAIAALDAKINANVERVQKAAEAQRFGDIEAINAENEKLMQQKFALMGIGDTDATSEKIEADTKRDADASFQLTFEEPPAEPRQGDPYRTSAGHARVAAYDDKGVAYNDVTIDFDSMFAQRPVVRVHGDPARVRALLDAADLRSIAATR